MKINIRSAQLTVIVLMAQFIAGCGYIKSLFPDKERDYQFRNEIPELIVPDDLKAHSLPNSTNLQPVVAKPTPTQSQPILKADSASQENQANLEKTNANSEPAMTKPADQANMTKSTVSSLMVDQQQKQAWRLVARALSRQKVEIVERNIDQGYFYVKYDPDEIKPEDNSIWDEFTFLFGEDPSHEEEYRISLLEIAKLSTEVTIQDSKGNTLSTRPATHLLKLITDGINMEVPADNPNQNNN